MIKITLPDGSVLEREAGVTGYEIAESISPRLAADVIACGVNGETVRVDGGLEHYYFDRDYAPVKEAELL